jgi:hypothetical protein
MMFGHTPLQISCVADIQHAIGKAEKNIDIVFRHGGV